MFSDFSGGLNTAVESHLLPDNQSPYMRNVLIDEKPGALVTRKGYVLSGSTPTIGKITLMIPFVLSSGEEEFILSDSSIVLTTKDFANYTLLMSGLNSNYQLDAEQVQNKIWFTNGVNSVFTYDGSSVAVLDGRDNNPNAIKGEFIAYWLERVWTLNGSQLDWSAVTTTDTIPIAINPDSETAWRETNRLYIGEGDGTRGTGMFICNGQLMVSKERSIYTIYGEKDSQFQERKTITTDGAVGNNSIVSLDNLFYFIGENGVYKCDCAGLDRISDLIKNDVSAIIKDTSKIVATEWGVKADFDRGYYTYGSTATTDIIRPFLGFTTQYLFLNDTDQSTPTVVGTQHFTLVDCGNAEGTGAPGVDASTATDWGIMKTTSDALYDDNALYRISYFAPWVKRDNVATQATLRVAFRNLRTNATAHLIAPSGTLANHALGAVNEVTLRNLNFEVTGSDIKNDRVAVQFLIDNPLINNNTFHIYNATYTGAAGNARFYTSINSTVQYISDITTATTVTNWSTLDAGIETNGGAIDFYYRSATSPVNIATYPWVPISPGGVINSSPTDRYIQWATTISAIDLVNPPYIDWVQIKHNEGGTGLLVPFAERWKNRYWLFFTTESAGNVFNGFIKSINSNSNPDAWMFFNNIPIYSLREMSGNLYGGGNGSVYRLDYGTNDNGVATIAEYQMPDTFLGNIWYDKKLEDFMIDAKRETGKSIIFEKRYNLGSWSSESLSWDGSGRNIKWYDRDGSLGNIFGFRFRNEQIDKNIEMYNFGQFYSIQPYKSGKP